MENDFLDVDVAQPQKRPSTSELMQKLIAWAVITALDVHPNRKSMAPMLAFKHDGEDKYRSEMNNGEYYSMAAVFEGARERLSEEDGVEGYALIVDSVDYLEGFPEQRPTDLSGNDYPTDQPAIAVFAGERNVNGGVLVIQPYKIRRIRGGATPLGAPLILEGPASLLGRPFHKTLDEDTGTA